MDNALLDIINLGEDYFVFISKCFFDFYDGKNIRVRVRRRYHDVRVTEEEFNDPYFFDTVLVEVKHELSDEVCKKKILDMVNESD